MSARAPTGWPGTTTTGWIAPWRRSVGRPRWSVALLGAPTAALVCVHGAHVHGGGLDAQGVAIVPAHLLRGAIGYDQVLSDAEVALLATTAWTSLRPVT